jgi:hypothetical protein
VVGDLPERAFVAIGGEPAQLVARGDGYVVVVTGLHDPGVVDVVVTDSVTGASAALTGAFTYEAPEAPSSDPASGRGSSPGGGDTVSGGAAPGGGSSDGSGAAASGESPSGGDFSDPEPGYGELPNPESSPTDPTLGDVPTTSDEVSPEVGPGDGVGAQAPDDEAASEQALDSWLSDRVVTPVGLDLVILPASDPLAGLDFEKAAASMCGSPECPGWVLPLDPTGDPHDHRNDHLLDDHPSATHETEKPSQGGKKDGKKDG